MTGSDPHLLDPQATPTHGPGTVLIVDDERSILESLAKIFEREGLSVLTAADAPTGLELLRRHRVGVLLTDLMMPGGMSGVDLLHEARRLHPKLKALLTSGYPAQVIESRGPAPTDAPLLGKPYRKRELARAIRAALDA